MAPTVSPRSGHSTASLLLYLGVIVFIALAGFTVRSVWRAFEERSGQARAAAVFDLVATRTASRPTDAPGAMAWLRRAIDRGVSTPAETSLVDPSDAIPPALVEIATLLDPKSHSFRSVDAPAFEDAVDLPGAVRRQQLVHFGGRTLVVTRRRALDDGGVAGSDTATFVKSSTLMLVAAESRLREYLGRRPTTATLAGHAARPVRLYAVHEDATLLSLPWIGRDESDGARDVAQQELNLLSTRPNLPAFAPEDFFFRSNNDAYSGIYLDLGGRGLVSTVTMPFVSGNDTRAVLALDLAFDVDWRALATSLETPIVGAAVDVPAGESATWATFATSLPTSAPAPLRRAMDDASLRGRASGTTEVGAPLRHALVDGGAIAAFHVSDRTWLLAWFPQTAPAFPIAAVTLQSVLLALLLTGFEINRRRADRERRSAERALQEKQNLLNTMQVPLVVVDPNDDAIVSANRAADAIGFRAGRRFADLVWPDARARAHYDRMQVASPEPRRAYGVPVAVINEKGAVERRYAVVRSVAVTAPIEALNADERHRLGVLILLDETDDLALMIEDRDATAHRDERRRLAGLLSHGLDTLARVLAWGQTGVRPGSDRGQTTEASDTAFLAWLAGYLERRVGVTAWLLDHWDATPPLPRESVIDAAQARATIDRLHDVLTMAAGDRELRQRLHWDNGTLSSPARRVLDVTLDWPDDVVVTCPVHGGFGLFLSELVANAVKHGAPGTAPSVTMTCDRVRGELICEIANDVRAGTADVSRADAYGGVAMLRAMSRLFEWPNLRFDAVVSDSAARFTASWTMPISTRAAEAD